MEWGEARAAVASAGVESDFPAVVIRAVAEAAGTPVAVVVAIQAAAEAGEVAADATAIQMIRIRMALGGKAAVTAAVPTMV